MISVQHLSKRYGPRTAVDDLAFEVAKGEIVGFLGPNGAGKSTTLRMITGYLAPSAGAVTIDGIDVQADPARARAGFGYLPEGMPLYPEMRVHEYLAYRAALKGVSGKGVAREVDRCLDAAGVADSKQRIIGQLSKGTRQRVGIADALLADPPLLILDEPTSGLDPNQLRHVRELITGFAGEKTVFLSTHILPEVESTCERVIIIREGRKVAEGTMAELRARATGEQQLTLDGRGSVAAFRDALAAVAGVRRAEFESPDELRAQVSLALDPGERVVDEVFAAIVGAGLSLREMRREQSSLEELFTELTTTGAGPLNEVEPTEERP